MNTLIYMDAKLTKIYYSPKGYWKGIAAIKKLANAAKVSEDEAKRWLTKQALWQVYLPGPHYIPRPKFDVSTPNAVHQADLLFLPHDKLPRGKKVYKYALTVVDVASRYKAAEALTSKESDEVSRGFAKIYKHGSLKWPQMLQVDPGREFMGAVTKVSEDEAKRWLTKQALWQVYLPGPHYIPRPKFDVSTPNAVHQADLLFLPHDKLPRGKKVYKYALTVVDVASRYKAAEALTSKESDEVSRGFAKIYKHGPLKWPQMLQVDPGREFMGAVTKAMSEHNVTIRRGRTNIHRDQAIVERFNRTLAEKLFGFQYAVEMNMPSGRSTAWVKRLPEVVSSLNNEVTRLIGKKPAVAIREKVISAKPATTYMRPIGENERKLPLYAHVRYLYYPGELEGGGRRATDPIWSLKVFKIQKVVTKPETPVVYYLLDGPKRGFVREELMVVPLGTVLPPVGSLH